MKLIIAGSRSLSVNSDFIAQVLYHYELPNDLEIVSGGAKGIDSSADMFAEDCAYPFKLFKADWDFYGKKAGFVRNIEMAEYADALLAIWDGVSKGTLHMLNEMDIRKKPIYKVTLEVFNIPVDDE